MSRKDHKHYACIHDQCPFRTDKRKAIYTHLVRTHSERKEDYECEYCSTMFELDTDIENHLHIQHPEQAFTYTCVSRIEKVINNCAKLGEETRKSKTPVKSSESDVKAAKTPNCKTPTKTPPKTENNSTSPISKPPYSKPNISMRTRASVNASLNSIAKQPKTASDGNDDITDADQSMFMNVKSEPYNDDGDDDDDFDRDTDEESPTYISKPSGLKIKLSLKRTHSDDSRDISSERSSSPPVLEPNYTYQMDTVEPPDHPDDTPPDIMRTPTAVGAVSVAQVRVKDSKYYDKLEVYHRTDEFGRRCCPFCDYKTSKNTIRVHLSGIHKIHFVKCSLCDYKAAFPHQITQHGLKFHKTTNMNVIQLSKESRDKTIAKLKGNGGTGKPVNKIYRHTSLNADNDSMIANSGKEIIDDEDFNSEESISSADEIEPSVAADERHFKPPKCQTSKTDYYSIRVDNGVYLYTCNLCTFQTPVRATIYTHKYRHEEKSYRCGYCDFTSAPRSNVVHHCRVKHKMSPVHVIENDIDEDCNDGNHDAAADDVVSDSSGLKTKIKVEPLDSSYSTNGYVGSTQMTHATANRHQDKSHQTIIKVPQFKTSFASESFNEKRKSTDGSLQSGEVVPGVEYKLSLNKLYRINPMGSPKFMCALCPYACDTHPKMKHHLYRHRPQKYKCPYCDHRKYPRSYVVRHVRDTHRNKPVRVIDLSKGNEPEDIPEYANDSLVDDIEGSPEHIDGEDADRTTDLDTIQAGKRDVSNDVIDDGAEEQHEEVNALKQFAQKLNLRSVLSTDLSDDMFLQSPDVSPNFSESVYTSTPLIESFISGKYPNQSLPKQQSKNFEKKKSLKDYRVNYGHGPRYICNKCGYGTENYKTIHNHMYRHESQRYQCPYCGYRRSPKSFVENHIREVHKGHPVIVTELNIDQEMADTPTGSPRQCVGLKRKESVQDSMDDKQLSDTPNKIHFVDTNTVNKLPAKWPAPKPASEVKISKQTATVEEEIPDNVAECPADMALKSMSGTPITNTFNNQMSNASPMLLSQINKPMKVKQFVERNRTTFKSIYKCVFDPETCNHISKDKSKMKQHLFMHVEYKPWSCDICDMVASQSSHIKNHVRTEHKYAPDTSFKYKRHNYLEKHIEGFLSKGLFTVPVNEYRAIMDMKGNTKCTKQPTFGRDVEGNLVCPYCPYRTKSGGMMDHVKMKHMQPRFKCHWCEFTAFYKSEVRKHHRKEKGHGGLEFKTQELDLIQVVENSRNKQGVQSIAALNTSNANTNIALDPSLYLDEECDDIEEDDNSECSSSGASSVSDFQQGYTEYTTEQLSEICSSQSKNIDDEEVADIPLTDNQVLAGDINTEIGPDGCMKIVQKPKLIAKSDPETVLKESKFKCGYCSFSAALRVKVKMHSSKRHPGKVPNIIEPNTKRDQTILNENLDLHADDWKGTKFEQDLRRAGVSKLNLASLFPNSKRFVPGSGGISPSDFEGKSTDMDDTDEIRESDNTRDDIDSNVEFKKPLDPVVKKTDRKPELNDDKQCITIENVNHNDKDNMETDDLGQNHNEDSLKETHELVISNVRSLNECDHKPDSIADDVSSNANLLEENASVISDNSDGVKKDKIVTAFTNESNEKTPQTTEHDDQPNNTTFESDGAENNGKLNDSEALNGESSLEHGDNKTIDNSTMGETNGNITNDISIAEDKDRADEISSATKLTSRVNNGVQEEDDSPIHDENGGIYALDGTLKENQEAYVSLLKDSMDINEDVSENKLSLKRKHSLDMQQNGMDKCTSEDNNVTDTSDPPRKKLKTAVV